MNERIVTTPEDEARFKFDAEHKVFPARTIAENILIKYRIYNDIRSYLLDDISHAIEDARELGEKRAALKYGKRKAEIVPMGPKDDPYKVFKIVER